MDESDVERCLKYYDLEGYLFGSVGPRFRNGGSLSAFEFFSIVVWKANRAKTRVAKILRRGRPGKSWDAIVGELATSLSHARDDRSKLAVLVQDYGFYLPMASAILTVLWPDSFSVYDVRVCEILGRFGALGQSTNIESLWPAYEQYVQAVQAEVPGRFTLREKDRALWALSTRSQLEHDMKCWLNDGTPNEEI